MAWAARRGLRRRLRRTLRCCRRGRSLRAKGQVDGGLRATRRRMIGPSSALTVHAGGGRKGVEQVEGAPQASVGRRRAVEGPAQVNPLVHGHSCRHGGGEAPPSRRAPLRAGLRRLRRHRSTNSSQTSSAVSRRSAPLAFAGAAALGARAETWSSGPYRALALGSVAAAAFPELAPSPPASAGHRGARPMGGGPAHRRSSRSCSDGLCARERGV